MSLPDINSALKLYIEKLWEKTYKEFETSLIPVITNDKTFNDVITAFTETNEDICTIDKPMLKTLIISEFKDHCTSKIVEIISSCKSIDVHDKKFYWNDFVTKWNNILVPDGKFLSFLIDLRRVYGYVPGISESIQKTSLEQPISTFIGLPSDSFCIKTFLKVNDSFQRVPLTLVDLLKDKYTSLYFTYDSIINIPYPKSGTNPSKSRQINVFSGVRPRLNITKSRPRIHEREIQEIMEKATGGKHQRCAVGIPDIVSDTEVIEIKRSEDFKHAFGQIVFYMLEFPDKIPRVHLFDEGITKEKIEKIKRVAKLLGVRLTMHTLHGDLVLNDVSMRHHPTKILKESYLRGFGREGEIDYVSIFKDRLNEVIGDYGDINIITDDLLKKWIKKQLKKQESAAFQEKEVTKSVNKSVISQQIIPVRCDKNTNYNSYPMEESWIFIFDFLTSPRDFRELGLTCKQNYKTLGKFEKKLRNTRHIERLLRYFPDKPWDWNHLSQNPSVTWDVIQKHLDKPWNWYYVSLKHSVTWDIIQQNPDIPWHWKNISGNPSITLKIVQQNPDKQWYWTTLSENPSVATPEIVRQNPGERWSWSTLSRNSSITCKFVTENLDKPWSWFRLSSNPSINCEFIQQNLDKAWSWWEISKRPSITWDFLKQNLNRRWSFHYLSYNPSLPWKLVQQNPNKTWNWSDLSGNFYVVTWDIVRQNLDKPWDWNILSKNSSVATWDIVQKNLDKPWDWNELSSNPSISWEIVQQNPDKPWSLDGLSSNPSISWEVVQQNPYKEWNWFNLSQNKFNYKK